MKIYELRRRGNIVEQEYFQILRGQQHNDDIKEQKGQIHIKTEVDFEEYSMQEVSSSDSIREIIFLKEIATKIRSRKVKQVQRRLPKKHEVIQISNFEIKSSFETVESSSGIIKCPICHKSLKTKRYLQKHIRRMHSEKTPYSYPYTCDICDKPVHHRQHLEYHMKQHFECKANTCSKKEEHRTFECEKCFRSFKTYWALEQHQITHSSNYSCLIL